ncbi:MAG: protein kinase domain-containing protein [Myxococcales bacterium]
MRQPIKFGKYLLLERIAVGGMAEVYAAKAFGAAGFERLLAIKRILPTMNEDPEFIQMFVDEARIAAQLSHANIVQVIELGKHEDSYFIAMEYISGRDVRQLNERFRKIGRPMPIPQATFILSRICEALDYAHRRRDGHGVPLGIVHRDISPQNVLVSFDGNVKLIDFGIAKAESRFSKTQAGILKGKFSYMSPEQVKGQGVDHRSDIFASGVLLWEMLCGQKLFTGDSDIAVLEKVRAAEVPPPRSLNPRVPESLEAVVLRALAADPRDRYQWASEMHDDLLRHTFQAGAPYGSRQLSEWLLEEFQGEREKEEARISRWVAVERRATEASASIPSFPRRGNGGVLANDLRRTEPEWHVAIEAETIVQPPTPVGTPRPTKRISLPGEDSPKAPAPVAAVPPPPPPPPREASGPRPSPVAPSPDRTRPSPPPALPTQMLEAGSSRAVPFDNRNDRTGAVRKRRSGSLTRPSRPVEGWRGLRIVLLIGAAAAIVAVAGFAFLVQQPAAQRPGKIVVTVSPAVDAELFVDGHSSGRVPPHLRSLAAGDHLIEVKAAGYRAFATTVSVRSGSRPVEIEAALQPQTQPAPPDGAELHGATAPR